MPKLDRDGIHNAIATHYKALNVATPHPLPIHKENLDELMTLLGGINPHATCNDDGEIVELVYDTPASLMAKKRWANISSEQRREHARKAGKKRWTDISDKKKSEHARLMNKKRWEK